MKTYLQSKYDRVIVSSEYLIAVGDCPVGLVAHLDTVFQNPPKNIFYDRVKNVMWSPEGLGADDRAGVYAIIQILKAGYRPTVIFTTNEEKGCLGAVTLASNVAKCPTELKYIIQLDRRGSNDCVFYDCANYKFDEYVESFGFVTNFGSFSDISEICPQWGIAGVNLSIGYYDEHSYIETLYIGQMLATIERVKKMLDVANSAPVFEYIESKFSSAWGLYPDDGWDPSWGISKEAWSSMIEPRKKCCKCGQDDFDYNMFPVEDENSNTVKYYCLNCITDEAKIQWCEQCGTPFISENQDKTCKKCRGLNGSK